MAVLCSLLAALLLAMSADGKGRICPSTVTTSTTTAGTTTAPTSTPHAPAAFSYWVSFPKSIKPGAPLAVSVYAPKASGPFTLRVNLVDSTGGNLQSGQNFTMKAKDAIQTVDFHVSKQLPKDPLPVYLRANAWGGLLFDAMEKVHLEKKHVSVFLQTDKLFYKPGQTVRFRTFSVFSDWMVTKKPVDVEIRDPNNRLVSCWLQAEGERNTGVFQDQMVTSYFPPLGDWRITATVDGITEEKKFTVKQYEQPQFEVKLFLPRYTFRTSTTVAVKVVGKYTFGSPVSGNGNIVVTSENSASLTKEFNLNENGEAGVSFPTAELLRLFEGSPIQSYQPRIIEFSATVHNDENDDVTTTTASLYIYDKPLAVGFVPGTPSVFKPGLPVTVSVQALEPDGKRPLADTENWQVDFTATFYKYNPASSYFTGGSEVVSTKQETVSFDIHGVAQFQTDPVLSNVTTVSVTASALNGAVKASKSFQPFTSPSNAFLKIRLKTTSAILDQYAVLEAVSSIAFKVLAYQVFSRNGLVLNGMVRSDDLKTQTDVTFKLTSEMAPTADVIMFIISEEGEVINDRLAIPVDAAFLNLAFNKEEEAPSKRVLLTVSGEKYSTVFLLGVDERLRSMGTGNDVTWKDVVSELAQYGDRRDYTSTDAAGVFEEAGVGFISNARVPGQDLSHTARDKRGTSSTTPKPTTTPVDTPLITMVNDPFEPPLSRRRRDSTEPDVSGTTADKRGTSSTTPKPTTTPVDTPLITMVNDLFESPLLRRRRDSTEPDVSGTTADWEPFHATADKLKKMMLDSWPWEDTSLGSRKRKRVTMTSPETLATWEVTGFAVHPTLGLYLTRTPAQLVTKDNFIPIIYLPHSAILGEDVCFKATAFNLDHRAAKVSMTLGRNIEEFQNILFETDPANPGVVKEKLTSKMIKAQPGKAEPNSSVSTTFCVRPLTLGNMKLSLSATGRGSRKRLYKSINIKPEGLERTQTYPVLIEIPEGQDAVFNRTVNISLPEHLVDGSVRMSVSVGGVMGYAAEHLSDPMTTPYRCAEDVLVKIAAEVNVLNYLEATKSGTDDLKAKVSDSLLRGYQSLLRYQHKDGSFSSFGPSSDSDVGNVWLTASVVRVLSRGAALPWKPEIVELIPQILMCLAKHQNTKGSFHEPRDVPYQEEGSTEDTALTAHVTVALAEAMAQLSDNMSSNVSEKVSATLEDAVGYLTTATDIDIVYPWDQYDSLEARAARNQMEMLAVATDTQRRRSESGTTERQGDTPSIKNASYAMTTYLRAGMLESALPKYRWLIQQRRPNGMFLSSEASIVAMKALSTMAEFLVVRNLSSPIDVTFTWEESTSSYSIDPTLGLNNMEFQIGLTNNDYPRQMTISATSSRVEPTYALAQVTVHYNVKGDTVGGTFSADTTVTDVTTTSYTLRTCVQHAADLSSLVVVEIGIASGYDVVQDESGARSVIVAEDKVVLTYDTLDPDGECSVLTMEMFEGVTVAQHKPRPVRVYDYNNPDDEFTTSYSLTEYTLCQVNPAVCTVQT